MKMTVMTLGLSLAALAGAAHAGTAPPADPLRAAAFRASPAPAPAGLYLAKSTPTPTGADALPKRAIDLRFAPQDVTGSVGFLCGREPGQGHTGSASAFGYDPHGRFLGAKLSRAF